MDRRVIFSLLVSIILLTTNVQCKDTNGVHFFNIEQNEGQNTYGSELHNILNGLKNTLARFLSSTHDQQDAKVPQPSKENVPQSDIINPTFQSVNVDNDLEHNQADQNQKEAANLMDHGKNVNDVHHEEDSSTQNEAKNVVKNNHQAQIKTSNNETHTDQGQSQGQDIPTYSELVSIFHSTFPTLDHFERHLESLGKQPELGLNGKCLIHVLDTLQAFRTGELWSMRLFDSFGKPGAGMLRLYPVLRGSYHECRDVVAYKGSKRSPPAPTNHPLDLSANTPSSPSNHTEHEVLRTTTPEDGYGRMMSQMVKYSGMWQRQGQKVKDREVAFRGKFCQTGIGPKRRMNRVPILNIVIGVSMDICVPDSCDGHDVRVMANKTVELMLMHTQMALIEVVDTLCQEERPWESKTIGAVVFLAAAITWIAICTTYDVVFIQRPKWHLQKLKKQFLERRTSLLKASDIPEGNGHLANGNNGSSINNNITDDRTRLFGNDPRSRDLGGLSESAIASGAAGLATGSSAGGADSWEEILFKPPQLTTMSRWMQFISIYTNGRKLLNTAVPEGTLTCIHGIRFLSMCWIILGHTLVCGLVATENIVEYIFEMRQKMLFLIIANGFLCVDTFFVISGVMVGYVFIDVAHHESRLRWVVYVLHRYIRFTPTVVVVGVVYICLWPQLGSGPNYPAAAPDESMCRENWMYTLFYINNFLPMEKLCLMWTWYLSCDYQFYLVCTIFMVPLVKGYVKTGIFIGLMFALASIITSGVISYVNHMSELLPQIFTDTGISDPRLYYNEYYQRPYTRMGPYVIGLFLGHVLKTRQRKLSMHWAVQVCGWVLSTVAALTILFGPHQSFARTHIMTNLQTALYNAIKHTAFGLSVAWVILACVTQHGGWVNTFLSWPAFIPLSRVTFCMYLVHAPIIYLVSYSFTGVVVLNTWTLLLHFCGILFLSIVCGALMSLTAESITIRIEKDILRRLGYITDSSMSEM